MWNSWGDFPAPGVFEGTFTSMGSYYGCVDTKANDFIGEAQYCTLKYQPIVPKRPRYHNILATIPDLANFTQEQDVSISDTHTHTTATSMASMANYSTQYAKFACIKLP